MIIEATTGLLEIPCGAIWFVQDEFVCRVTVECDLVFCLDPGQRENVGDPVGVKPHSTISWEVTNEVSPCHPSGTMDIHVLTDAPDVL